jgi:septum formation protein
VTPPLILASKSPRREQLLSQLGLIFEVIPAELDEVLQPGEEPGAHAERLAREKALAVAGGRPEAIVIGADTVVVIDDAVLGKPRDFDDAVHMLLRLQGREHTVASGIAVAYDGGRVISTVERVRVRFRAFDGAFARAYVATGEPLDKAGAYGIQGYGAALVEGIEGDYFAVMGLPVARLLSLLQTLGLHYDFQGLSLSGLRP